MNTKLKDWVMASCVLAAAVFTTPASAAAGDQAIGAAPELEELEEYVVHGKRLEQRVRLAEERFYSRYNAVNERQDLDVDCNLPYLDRNSVSLRAVTLQRGCLPRFVVTASRSAYVYQPEPCRIPFIDSEGMWIRSQHFDATSMRVEQCSRLFTDEPALAMAPGSMRAELIWLGRRAEFLDNVSRVLAVDADLRAMARDLDALAGESKEIRQRIAEYRKLRMAERRCAPSGSLRSTFKTCQT